MTSKSAPLHPLFLAYCERMTPARLAFVAVYASALQLDFADLEQHQPYVELLARLAPKHLTHSLVRISLQILTVGLTDVLGLLPPKSVAAHHHPLRAAMRAFFCAAVLVFRRMIRHRPERISAWVRLLLHGPYLHGFLQERLHSASGGTGAEAVHALRGCMTFAGFTVHELLMRSDPNLVGLPAALYGKDITSHTLLAEQVDWSTRSGGGGGGGGEAGAMELELEEAQPPHHGALIFGLETGDCGGGDVGDASPASYHDHQRLLLAVDDLLRDRPRDLYYAAYAHAHVSFYRHYQRLLLSAPPPWCTDLQAALPSTLALPLAAAAWDAHLDAVILRHFFTLLCHNNTDPPSAEAPTPRDKPDSARLDAFGCASDAHLPMQLTLHAEFAASYYAMAPYVDHLRRAAAAVAASAAHHE